MKNLLVIFFLCLSATACNETTFFDEEVELVIMSKLQDCEEQNLHFTVLDVKSGTGISSGEVVLPELKGRMNTGVNNELLFPVERDSSEVMILVRGRLSEKGHSKTFEGCTGSRVLRITEISQ